MPFESFVPSPILTLIEAPLKAAIEAGYARDVNPGVATKVGLLPFRDPVQAIVNIIKAIPVGIDDAIAEATGDPADRPLGNRRGDQSVRCRGSRLTPTAPGDPGRGIGDVAYGR